MGISWSGRMCCAECFGDPVLRAFIERTGHEGDCDFCGQTDTSVATTDAVGTIIREGLQRAYSLAGEEAGPYDSEEHSFVWGDPSDAEGIDEVLDREAFSDRISGSGLSRRLAEALLQDSAHYSPDEHVLDPFPTADTPVFLRNEFFGRQDTGFDEAWRAFKYTVAHVARFFEAPKASIPRRRLLRPVMDIAERTEAYLTEGSVLWRAREVARTKKVPMRPGGRSGAVGPAPPRKAKGNRMSPPGISFMYLGDTPRTSAVEIGAGRGRFVWLGKFQTTRPLRLLNLSHTAQVLRRSIFADDYDHDATWAPGILRDFAKEIAGPVRARDRELDYVPTQVLSERIRLRGFDGLLYSSAKVKGGLNYALFCGPLAVPPPFDNPFPGGMEGVWPPRGLPAYTEWMELVEFRRVWARGARAMRQ